MVSNEPSRIRTTRHSWASTWRGGRWTGTEPNSVTLLPSASPRSGRSSLASKGHVSGQTGDVQIAGIFDAEAHLKDTLLLRRQGELPLQHVQLGALVGLGAHLQQAYFDALMLGHGQAVAQGNALWGGAKVAHLHAIGVGDAPQVGLQH